MSPFGRAHHAPPHHGHALERAEDKALEYKPDHADHDQRRQHDVRIETCHPLAARTMPHRITVMRSREPKTKRSNTNPIMPITISDASMISVLRNSLASKIT